MIALLFLLLAAGPPGEDSDTRYVDASLEPEGEILSTRFVDVDADGKVELALALRLADGTRELRMHRLSGSELAREPYYTVPILEDAIAYGFADVREEPGRELFFLTRSGAWSYSLTKTGFRGNIERLVELELIYDVPDPRAFPAWPYVFEGPGGDWILLPERGEFVVWSASGSQGDAVEASYRLRFPAPEEVEEAETDQDEEAKDRDSRRNRDDRTSVTFGSGGLRISRDAESLPEIFLERGGTKGNLLAARHRNRAPAVVDLDGDGNLDLLRRVENSLHVHLADARGRLSPTPTRTEAFPEYLVPDGDEKLELELHDFDGDGRIDLVGKTEEEDEGLGNGKIDLRFLRNDGRRLLPETPHQVLRFEAAELRMHITDVDGDGRLDLALRKFVMPSLLGTVSGLEFKLTHLLHLGEKGTRPFARKPVMKQLQTFDENTLGEAIRNRELEMDCDGDGIADMVELDPLGRVAIRRLRKSSSFFGGTSWSIEESPWLRFDVYGNLESVSVEDLNGDGLGDVVSVGTTNLTLLLSQRR